MSWLSKFVFDPIQAAIARATTSSNPAIAAGAAKLSTTATGISASVAAGAAQGGALTANSAAGIGSDVVGQLENGLIAAVDAFLTTALATAGPVGAVLSGPAVQGTNALLVFGEQHAMTFLASLFHHAKAQVAAVPAPPTIGQA